MSGEIFALIAIWHLAFGGGQASFSVSGQNVPINHFLIWHLGLC